MFKFYVVLGLVIIVGLVIYARKSGITLPTKADIESTFLPMIYTTPEVRGCDNETSLFGVNMRVQRDYVEKKDAATILNYFDVLYRAMIRHLGREYRDIEFVRSMINNFNNRYNHKLLYEGKPNGETTSYLINKKLFVLCLRDENGEFHDINTLTMVALHELAHLLIDDYHHNRTFQIVNKFLLREAERLGLYKNIDYSKNRVKFCGRVILDKKIEY